MMYENTVANSVTFQGPDLLGKNEVKVTIHPSYKNGIVYLTDQGRVHAKLENASTIGKTIALKENGATVVVSEHNLATLGAYRVTQGEVEIKRIPSKSYSFQRKLRLATKKNILPTPEDRELTLCRLLDEVGIKQLDSEREVRTIARPYKTKHWSFYPTDKSGLYITAETSYSRFPEVGKQSHSMKITPEEYKKIARSRPYRSHIPFYVSDTALSLISLGAHIFLFPNYGLGHNIKPDTFFPPPSKREPDVKAAWEATELMPNEIARHTIVDKILLFALFDFSLDGIEMRTYKSNHKNDLQVFSRAEAAGLFVPVKPDSFLRNAAE